LLPAGLMRLGNPRQLIHIRRCDLPPVGDADIEEMQPAA